MAINISTTEYENTHGAKPTGRANWGFVRVDGDGSVVWSPADLTVREACAWLRQTTRRAGYQDASFYLAA